LTAELSKRELADRVTVRRTSHVGGHAFAGNVLIYPGGDWYGYVTPEDIPRLVENHLVEGQIVTDLWRGRMGMIPEVQIGVV
jgi:(2Fe-2S) ferredoxin